MNRARTMESRELIFSDFADDSDFREILQFFVEEIPGKQEALQNAFQSEDLEGLRSQAHQLKGAGGGYGFAELTQSAWELEQACSSNDLGTIRTALDRLVSLMDRISV